MGSKLLRVCVQINCCGEEVLHHGTIVAKLFRIVANEVPARQLKTANLSQHCFARHRGGVFDAVHTRGAVFTDRDWLFPIGRPREKVFSLLAALAQ
jgi:hypothetical protein